MPEGRVLNVSGTLTQEYVISDQQGNARLSFQNNGSGAAVVTQENSYYGFGMILPNSIITTPTNDNKHLYNGGSEWQNDFSNLPNYYQTFYRNYDSAIGRFVAVDPVAESAMSMTGYQYAGNNPIMYNDPAGANKAPGPQSFGYTQGPTIYTLTVGYAIWSDANGGEGESDYAIGVSSITGSGGGGSYNFGPNGPYGPGGPASSSNSGGNNDNNGGSTTNNSKGTVTAGPLSPGAVVPSNDADQPTQGTPLSGVTVTPDQSDPPTQGKLLAGTTITDMAPRRVDSGYPSWWQGFLNYLSNVGTAATMTREFFTGTGPDNRVFINNRVTDEMRRSKSIQKARSFFYNKYKLTADLTNARVGDYGISFGLKGLYQAGLNPIQQFVGSYSVDIFVVNNMLVFAVFNRTSFTSLFYDQGPNWERAQGSIMGNTYQEYIWTEPIRRP